MRILIVIPYFYPALFFGGPVKVAFDVGKELVKRGNEVVVFTSDAQDLRNRLPDVSNEVEGMQVYYFHNLSMLSAAFSKLFVTPGLNDRMKLDVGSFDIIHAHEYTTYQNIIVQKFAKKSGVPYVLQAHGSLPRIGRKTRKWLYDFFFGHRILRDASKVIALNEMEAKQYMKMGVTECKITIIPNGIDFSEYSNLPPKGSFKKKFNIPANKKIILYLGRIHQVKGIDFLIKAYDYLIKNMRYNEAILVIAGPDDGYLDNTRSLIDKLKLQHEVLLTGSIYGNAKLEAFVDSDLYVLPSRYETFPMSLLEAYVCGKPAITSRIEGLNDLVLENVTGFSVEPDNVENMAIRMLFLLNDENKIKEIGMNSRKFVEKFAIEKVVDKLVQLYEEIVSAQS